MILEVRVVTADGHLGEILPDWKNIQYLDSSTQVGSIQLEYPQDGIRFDRLHTNQEYALLVDGEEAPNGRFRLQETDGNRVADGTSIIRWSGATLLDRFDEAIVAPISKADKGVASVSTQEQAQHARSVERTAATDRRTRGSRGGKNKGQKKKDKAPKPPKPPAFVDDTPGQIIRYLVEKAKQRGALSEIEVGFTSDRDSNGVRWTDLITNTWEVGTSVLQVISDLTENEHVEFRMVGRTLMGYDASTVDTTKGTDALLARGKNLLDGPVQGSSRDLVTALYAISDKGPNGWVESRNAINSEGRAEAAFQGTQRAWERLERSALRRISAYGRTRYQYTYGVTPGHGGDPYKDYHIGDWVDVLDGEEVSRRRVREIGISSDGTNVKIAVVVNDLIIEQELANATAVAAATGRASTSNSLVRSRGFTTTQASDGFAPYKPSAPVVTARSGAARIVYDGYDADGEDPENDQVGVEVHLGTDQDFEPTDATLTDTIQVSGGVTLTAEDLLFVTTTPAGDEPVVEGNVDPYALTVWARFVAVDEGGDKSDPSDSVPLTVPQTVIDDVNLTGLVITDKNPPGSSPTPEVIPGIGAFYLRWVPPANNDPLFFDIYVGDAPGFPLDADHLYTVTATNSVTVKKLAGTVTPEDDRRFVYDKDYYFRILAEDDDGPAPAAGGEVSGRMVQVTGPDIAAESVNADKIVARSLTGDLFSGTVVLGSTITTGAIDPETGLPVGARVELGPAGLVNYDANNAPVVQFPLADTGSAFVRARFDLLEATVRGNLSIRGLNNQIAQDSAVVLAEGVAPPTVSPQISYEYDTVKFDTSTAVPPHTPNLGYNLGTFSFNPAQATSITWDFEWNCWTVVQQKSGGFRVWRFTAMGAIANNPATGRPWVDDYNDRSMCRIAQGRLTGATATLFKMSGNWWIFGYDPGGISQINQIPNSWILDATQAPGLGFDADTNRYVLVQNNGGTVHGFLHVRKFFLNAYGGNGPFPTASSTSVAQGAEGTAWRYPINGVIYGRQIDGVNTRLIQTADTMSDVHVWTSAIVQRNTDGTYEEWPAPSAVYGLGWNGSQFATMDATGLLTLYEDWNWPEASPTTYIGASAYDSTSGSGDTNNPHPGQQPGQHETPVGSIETIKQRRRARLVMTMGETQYAGGPDDPDLWKLYYYRGTSPPTPADYKFVDAIGAPNARVSKVISSDPLGGPPPGGLYGDPAAVNNFPATNPATIASTGTMVDDNPTILLTGDGSGRVGPYQWDADGNMPDWYALVSRSTSLEVRDTTNTLLATNVDDEDPLGLHSGGVLTAAADGIWRLITHVSWPNTNTTGRRYLGLSKNDPTLAAVLTEVNQNATASAQTHQQLYWEGRLAEGDGLRTFAWQNSGVILNLVKITTSFVWVRP